MLILLCKTQIKKKYLSTLLSTPLPSYLHHYAESPVSTPFPVITPTALSPPPAEPYLHRHRPAELPLLYYSEEFGIHHTTVGDHNKSLGFVLKQSVWVPHELTEKNLSDRVRMCSSHLIRHNVEPFLDQLITGDEK
ncbi:mariner Mos1 transposase [Trichonephila clavipes]|nr:mariner Mos1 transposase [Trichonephila clavipes]